jgi:hypothetical protein
MANVRASGKFNYSPAVVDFGPFCMASTLGQAEQEDAAFRLLKYSEGQDEWVGVASEKYMEKAQKDLARHNPVWGWLVDGFNPLIERGYIEFAVLPNSSSTAGFSLYIFPTPRLVDQVFTGQQRQKQLHSR